ncbi:hypothetical protein ACMBCN_01485 [Candidatus Liberibacter asiaticus]
MELLDGGGRRKFWELQYSGNCRNKIVRQERNRHNSNQLNIKQINRQTQTNKQTNKHTNQQMANKYNFSNKNPIRLHQFNLF